MTGLVPLATLLSRVLIAFTIEFDNEAERALLARGPRRTFLTSRVYWTNLLRYVGAGGVAVDDLRAAARLSKAELRIRLHEITRWRIALVDGGAVRLTPAGRDVCAVWEPLAIAIEARWRSRFGVATVDMLCDALREVAGRFDVALPHALPIVGYHMFAAVESPAPAAGDRAASLDLPSLLSVVLLALTLAYEAGARLSLTMSANAIRALEATPLPLRDLPQRTGMAREVSAVIAGFLTKHDVVAIEPGPAGSRGKTVRLTPAGLDAQATYHRRIAATEDAWRERYGAPTVDRLRAALAAIAGDPAFGAGLLPPPAGWRASSRYRAQSAAFVREPNAALPHHPIVTHRGGWPDGS